jgi:hypothetical protein
VDQRLIETAFALKPTDRLILPNSCDVSHLDFQRLATLDSLASVELLPANKLCHVSRNVRHLDIVTDRGRSPNGFLSTKEECCLAKLVRLKSLRICLDASELSILENLKSLETLNLWGSSLGQCSLNEVAALPRLRNLYLNSTGIGNGSIAVLSYSGTLTKISLANTNVTGEALSELVRIRNLESLDIVGTEIRSNDFRGPWPALKELYLSSTQMGSDKVESLQNRMRSTEIIIR